MTNKITDKVLKDLILEVLNNDKILAEAMPTQLQNLSTFYTTSPIFKFDLFTGGNLSMVSPSKIQSQTGKMSKIIKNVHERLINAKQGSTVFSALAFLHNLFDDPLNALSSVKDLDSDASTVDDQISTFFITYVFYSFLDNLVKMNESSMGFQLENWLALVLGGGALTAGASGDAYDITDRSGKEYSLKFYLPSGTISQAFSNIDQGSTYTYIIAVKDQKQPTEIEFYSGDIDGTDLAKGVSVKNFKQDNPTVLARLDLVKFSQIINKLKSQTANKTEEIIAKFVLQFGENIEQLKIFLSYWFLESTQNPNTKNLQAAANGIKVASENCIFSLNNIASKTAGLQGPSVQSGKSYNSQMKKILSDNSGLVRTMELPDIRVDQIHGQTVNQSVVQDFILDKVSGILSKSQGKDIIKNFSAAVSETQRILEEYMNKINSSNLSLSDCFAAMIVLDSFKYLYDLKTSKGELDVGGGPGAATAGFIFESFVSLFSKNSTLTSYAIGGTGQKIDYCIIQPSTKKGGKKFEVLGFSSKSSGTEISHFGSKGGAGSFIWNGDWTKQREIWRDYPALLDRNREFLLSKKISGAEKMPKKDVFDNLVSLLDAARAKDKKSKRKDSKFAKKFADEYNKFFADLRKIKDSGNSMIVWVSCVKAHCDDGKSTPAMKSAVDAVINKALDIAAEQGYGDDLGTLFGGQVRKRGVYKILKETKEYKAYTKLVGQLYDLKIGMIGNPASEENQTISISTGPASAHNYFATKGDFKHAFQIASFDVSNYHQTLNNLKNKINETKDNFLKAFEEYNEFKITSAEFLNNPDQNLWNISYTNYDEFRTLANVLFRSSGLKTQIAEQKLITLDMLQKLISESFKR